MAKEYYKEGSHLIRRVIKLPNQGSGNYLYSIIGEDEFDFLYRWLPDNTWEEIPLTFGRGRTYVEQGDNVILLGDGSEENPYIINAQVDVGGELEKISRSGREFYRLKGQPDQNFALGGKYSINFSRSTDLSGVMGPTGESSVQFSTNSVTSGKRSMTVGENNINPHNETFVVGNTARGQVSNTYSSANIIVSDDSGRGGIKTYNNLYGNIIGGSDSEIGTEGVNLDTAVVYGSIVYGINNTVYAAESSLYAGHALTGGASRCAVVGTANIDLTETTATQKIQSNSAYNPRFIVGVGDWNSETNSGTRANGFVVMSDGTSNFPSLTNTKIDNSSDYSAVTKGWVNHAIGNIYTGIEEAPQDGKQYARKNASWVEIIEPEEALIYNPLPVILPPNHTAGKYKNGDTITPPPEGWTFEQLISDIVTGYNPPIFTAFTVTPQNNTVEIGTTLSGQRTFGWTIQSNSGNIPEVTIKDLTDGSDIATEITNTGNTIKGINTNLLGSDGQKQEWRVIGHNTTGSDINSSIFTVTARHRRYFGPISSFPTSATDPAQNRDNLSQEMNVGFQVNNNEFTFAPGTSLKMAVLIPWGKTVVSINDTGNLNADLLGDYEEYPGVIKINDINGDEQDYRMYTLTVGTPYNQNSRHKIKTN